MTFKIKKCFFYYFFTLSLASVLIWWGCGKDKFVESPRLTPTLDIKDARAFFESKIENKTSCCAEAREDSTEAIDEIPVDVDWPLAVSYFDETKSQAVVEAPILLDGLSTSLINPSGHLVDTASFLQRRPNHRLVIVKDTLGNIDFAIMKIEGTYHYRSTREADHHNTYRQVDSLFDGAVRYVDINDQVKGSFYRTGGQWHLVDSIRTIGLTNGEVDERWEIICIKFTTYHPCPCKPHHNWDERNDCKCGTKPDVSVTEVCYDVYPIGGFGGSSVPVFNPGSTWGNGGGSGGGGNPSQSCFMQQISAFNAEYDVDLLNDCFGVLPAISGVF
jgi:hypothetical protein